MAIFVERQHLHGNMPGRRILFQMIQNRPAEHVRQENIQRDCGRMVPLRQLQSFRPTVGDENLEALVARKIA